METAKGIVSNDPLPYFAGVLAAQLLSVLADPLHFMYEKANKFLNKGPQWNLKKLPSYWVDKILLNPPTEDNSHYLEVEWLLDILIDGLRTPAVGFSYHLVVMCAEWCAGNGALSPLQHVRTAPIAICIAIITRVLLPEDSGPALPLHVC